MQYRIIDPETDDSPCPGEVWYTRESAEEGLRYWQNATNRKLKIEEERD